MTEIKANNGKLYVFAIFDCFDSSVIGLAMDTKQKASLCVQTLENGAVKKLPKRKIAEVVKLQRFFGIINYANN